MSRVSEALQRAADERARLRPRADGPREPTPVESSNGANGAAPDSVQPSSVAPPEIVSPRKTWRETLEELFFGWDLKRFESHPLVALEGDSAAAEQYRILREQVKTLRNERGARSISITSPLKQDGKTTVAVNLAAALALGGEERVLLIDADLRSPDVHKYFGIRRYPGLADYLTSNSKGNLSSYIRPTLLPGLQVLAAGRVSDRAGELLAKGRMSSLLEEIRATYPDCQVVIDSPPVLATSDPLVLAREVGGVIMVVRAGKTRREYLKKAVEILNSPKLMGVVLNGAQFGMSYKYYYYTPVESDS